MVHSTYHVIRAQFVHSFTHAALSPDPDLAIAALMIARIEYPKLDARPYLDRLDAFGREARRRVAAAPVEPGEAPVRVDPEGYARVMALNDYLFRELRFACTRLILITFCFGAGRRFLLRRENITVQSSTGISTTCVTWMNCIAAA